MSATRSCPDCDGQVSQSAPTCPHCGLQFRRWPKRLQFIGATLAIISVFGLCTPGLGVADALLLPGLGVFVVGRFCE